MVVVSGSTWVRLGLMISPGLRTSPCDMIHCVSSLHSPPENKIMMYFVTWSVCLLLNLYILVMVTLYPACKYTFHNQFITLIHLFLVTYHVCHLG